jgi:hypothetical protein
MQRAGRRIALIALAAFLVLIGVFEFWANFRDAAGMDAMGRYTVPFLVNAIPVAAAAAFTGAALWLAGWIIEGFTKNNPS